MAVNGPIPDDFMPLPEDYLAPIRTIDESSFQVLDQLKLPFESIYETVTDVNGACDAIKTMKVRGAPAIATVAIKGIKCELQKYKSDTSLDADQFSSEINKLAEQLIACRPTAIDLKNAMNEIKCEMAKKDCLVGKIEIVESTINNLLYSEIEQNRTLVWNGYQEVTSLKSKGHKYTVMTICNTGTLATSSWGTALGVIYALFKTGQLEMVYALETRPYYQGLRLTATELASFGVPFKVIPDGAAASAMRKFNVDVVLTGVDQVTMNGDFANKIGTYNLSIAAKHHNIPFYPVVPRTSVNLSRWDGNDIIIEERPSKEMLATKDHFVAPSDTPVWNPAFDVTPSSLVTKFITDFGNFVPSEIHRASDILNTLK